jgi:hypothetical protein
MPLENINGKKKATISKEIKAKPIVNNIILFFKISTFLKKIFIYRMQE